MLNINRVMNKEIIRILKNCIRINIKNNDPFPESVNNREGVYLVGLTNNKFGGSDKFVCIYVYYPKYRHNTYDMTYGGYRWISDKTSEPEGWWTFNSVYNDKNNKEYAYIVDNQIDGDILAEFLNKINGYFNKDLIKEKIKELNVEIQKLESEKKFYTELLEELNTNSNISYNI